MNHVDRRICMYRADEARIFESPAHVPAGEGWVEHPSLVNSTKEQKNGKESVSPEGGYGPEESHPSEGRQGLEAGDGQERREVLNFDGLSKDDLIDVADKGGVKIDRRWGRDRIEAALRAA